MKRFNPFSTVSRWAISLVAILVSATSSGNAAVYVQVNPTDDIWRDVRRELEQSRLPQGIAPALAQVLGRLETGSDYRLIMKLSYSIAKPGDVKALDEFWTRYLTARRENAGFVTMLQMRDRVKGAQAMDRQSYLENWLYLAAGNGYDCGGGSGSGNCGNGLGNGGGVRDR